MHKKILTLLLIVALPLVATGSKRSDDIRVLIATSVSLAEATKVTADKNGIITFRGRNYKGKLQFYDDGKGALSAVNVIPMEEYLIGLVASEMPKDWPIEALHAQAVVARSYALFQKNAKKDGGSASIYDIESSTIDQVYGGVLKDDARVRTAVESTNGEVVTYHRKLLKTFFHSTCGGETESAANVWGEKGQPPAVKDPYCVKISPHAAWKYQLTENELVARLRKAGFSANAIKNIQIDTKKDGLRAAVVTINTDRQMIALQSNDFRKIVGFKDLKSTWFSVNKKNGVFIFNGRGYGHGAGMCQWGAKGMAEAGKNYKEMLKFYYPGTKIEKKSKK